MPEITESNVSQAWLRVVRLAAASPQGEVSNLVVNIPITTKGTQEDVELRTALDEALEMNGNFTVATVANTIFPISLWHRKRPRRILFERYLRLWPRISRFRHNRRGTYFQRLIGYPEFSEASFNQLEFVITAYRNRTRRRSALQCGILAPNFDLNATPFQGFPCMQQVAFLPEGRDGLRISALYPMQYLWARAYGNYIGLINLGTFMANQMGLKLTAMTCVSLIAKLDEPKLAQRLLEHPNEI
jgi:hypothetical protein